MNANLAFNIRCTYSPKLIFHILKMLSKFYYGLLYVMVNTNIVVSESH